MDGWNRQQTKMRISVLLRRCRSPSLLDIGQSSSAEALSLRKVSPDFHRTLLYCPKPRTWGFLLRRGELPPRLDASYNVFGRDTLDQIHHSMSTNQSRSWCFYLSNYSKESMAFFHPGLGDTIFPCVKHDTRPDIDGIGR